MRTAPFIRFFRTEQCAYHPSVTLDYLGGVNNRKFKQHCATKLLVGAASASVRQSPRQTPLVRGNAILSLGIKEESKGSGRTQVHN